MACVPTLRFSKFVLPVPHFLSMATIRGRVLTSSASPRRPNPDFLPIKQTPENTACRTGCREKATGKENKNKAGQSCAPILGQFCTPLDIVAVDRKKTGQSACHSTQLRNPYPGSGQRSTKGVVVARPCHGAIHGNISACRTDPETGNAGGNGSDTYQERQIQQCARPLDRNVP